MRVVFTDAVLADPAAVGVLDQIFTQLIRRRHVWSIPDPAAVRSSVWARDSKFANEIGDAVATAVRRSGLGHDPRLEVLVVRDADTEPDGGGRQVRVPLGRAQSYLADFLHVLLENPTSDRPFLNAALFKAARALLEEWLGVETVARLSLDYGRLDDERWYMVQHGGGRRPPQKLDEFS